MKTVQQCADILGISLGTIYKHIRAKTEWGQRFVLRQGVYVLNDGDIKKFPGLRKRVSKRGPVAHKKIGFRVTEWEHEAIETLAEGAGLTVAEWCRRASLGSHLTSSGPSVK